METWYRSVLEVLKFCSPQGVLGCAAINQVWSKAADSQEIWACLCEAEIAFSSTEHPKVTYRKWSYAQGILVHAKSASMRMFDCRKREWSPVVTLSVNIEVTFCSSAVLLADTRLLLCGGVDLGVRDSQCSGCAYILDLNGSVTSLEPLNVSRANHALIEVYRAVYVFGGMTRGRMGKSVGTSERISSPFVRKNWEILPEMTEPHFGFNPCKVREVIYLCGKIKFQVFIQSFNTFSLEFSNLHILLESTVQQQMCLFLHQGHLVVLQTKRLAVIDLVQKQVLSDQEHNGAFANGVMNPVLTGSRLCHLDYVSGRIFTFDLSTALA